MTNQGKNAVDILLAESFKELALKQPIEKITIKEITDKAGVIRPTFYNHFQDKYELLEWIIMTQIIEPIGPLLQNGMVHEALLLMFTSIEKEREFYIKACKLVLTLQGLDYQQIAEIMEKPAKSIDNALQRIKGKLRDDT